MATKPKSTNAVLAAANRRLVRVRAADELARQGAREAAVLAAADGMSQSEIARRLGVDRMSVREWVLGRR